MNGLETGSLDVFAFQHPRDGEHQAHTPQEETCGPATQHRRAAVILSLQILNGVGLSLPALVPTSGHLAPSPRVRGLSSRGGVYAAVALAFTTIFTFGTLRRIACRPGTKQEDVVLMDPGLLMPFVALGLALMLSNQVGLRWKFLYVFVLLYADSIVALTIVFLTDWLPGWRAG